MTLNELLSRVQHLVRDGFGPLLVLISPPDDEDNELEPVEIGYEDGEIWIDTKEVL